MLDKLIGEYGYGYGYGNGYGHKDHMSSGYGFKEHKEFVSHEESERGYFDRQARFDHHVRLPANHDRPLMAHMPVCDEEDSDSDVEEFNKRSQSHHTTVMPYHSNNHNQHAPHMNIVPPPPIGLSHHNGNMGNGWQGSHEDAYHGEHGMQYHGTDGMKPHGVHGIQHHGVYGMQHQGAHEMLQHGAHGMKHQDRLMAPQVQPHHVYMNPSHGSGHAAVVKASEKWRVNNYGGGHHKVGWGSKGL